jgi:hypothetical protein
MSKSFAKAPENEQAICLECGFCCDGTLFLRANLDSGESGNLPEKIEENRFFENGKELFRLPCSYFSGECSIYKNHRANVCGSYRCQLLKDLSHGKITSPEAIEIIRKARETAIALLNQYEIESGNRDTTNFRQLLLELGKILKFSSESNSITPGLETLQARCNIFEALLIRHFRSADDFEKIMQ